MRTVAIFVIISMAGCSNGRQPELNCAAPTVLQALQDSFFTGAGRRMDANAAENPLVDWVAVKGELQSLKIDNLFSISEIVFKGYDRETKATHCRAVVHIALPERYRNEAFVLMAKQVKDPETPADLFGDQPWVPIEYGVQPDVIGKRYIVSSNKIGPMVASLFVLSATRWQTAKLAP